MAHSEDSIDLDLDNLQNNKHVKKDTGSYGDFDTILPASTKEASSIKAIDKTSVHRICSGQVVLTLATAVKELVENSIDAGATSVEVKLKDYGSESIEVIDNGFGVEEKNFEGLTLKHHTSKLQDFEDLISVSTFGFRGEALSSLCALSNMTIITRHKSNAVGTRLEFDQNGKISAKKSAPRQIGTTVQILNIFHTLPVRHKEFQKNIKREFAKLIQVLNAYCIVNTGVRISCSNVTAKGSRNLIVSTNGNLSMKENIANVFSPKQLQSLLEFKQMDAEDDICTDFGIKPQQKSAVKFRIEGFVSQCEHGQGRSSSDRQFIFINKRPCDSVKIIKVVNEVYHSYNRHQNPFVAINITMDKESVDVNVTPDKRQIFLEGERLLLAVIKTSLIKMFEPTTSVFKVNNVLSPSHPSFSTTKWEINGNSMSPGPRGYNLNSENDSVFSDSPSLSHTLSALKRSFSSAFAKSDLSSSSSASPSKKKTELPSPLSSCRRSGTFPSTPHSASGSITQFFSRIPAHQEKKHPSCNRLHSGHTHTHDEAENGSSPDLGSEICEIMKNEACDGHVTAVTKDPADESLFKTDCHRKLCSNIVNEQGDCKLLYHSEDLSQSMPMSGSSTENIASDSDNVIHISSNKDSLENTKSSDTVYEREHAWHRKDTACSESPEIITLTKPEPQQSEIILTDQDLEENNAEKNQGKIERTVKFSFASLKKRYRSYNDNGTSSSSTFCRSFRAKICPADNKSAEDELQKEISKDMFAQMEILGQFNLGFIITKLGSDLFIVDQHATDEKYNFEMLQKHTVLQSQRLIVPQCMELTASNETILADNLEVFKKNGFDFKIEPDAPPTQRVKLVSAPASKNWTFGKDDIEEMVFMLTDTPNVMCRPTRIRMMFASRACRKSIMIGTPLNKAEMKKLVCHMGEIEQPWNCPHGRPTMRHLFNMEMLPS
ncbi:mismatch repair endonuclease pms2 [Plakobranchus ocellatus]|uniref:Mismatch repair endonuclease PMS2 n=1 Tax=Plakobranchus ocellatus TaxID=259542 RepID=A0AAV4CBL8_9GAST|nr:mismatch repair endonuclease pms2 [Plakobranchus ocellatus]